MNDEGRSDVPAHHTPPTVPPSKQQRPPTEQYLRTRLQGMDPEKFERLVADVWERLGWRTRVVGESGDRGIDVVATRGDEKQLIQAKRYGPDTTVGSPEVQQYAALRLQENSVDGVTIVTTGAFSRQAEELAPEVDVLLIDGEELLGMLEEIESWDVLADYFDDIEVADGEETSKDGLLQRVRSWLP